MSIKIYYDNIDFRIKGSRKFLKLIEKVIAKELMISGDLNFIITDDPNLKKINIEFLKHDYFTDVIAFDYNEGNILKGEIYISMDTIKKNAKNYEVSLQNELLRVMVHGTLHLCGYDDKTEELRNIMRLKENYWLIEFEKLC